MTRVDVTVNRARESFKMLTYFNKLTLKWVKAHRKNADAAVAANELANAAARRATTIEPAGSIEAPLALSEAKNTIEAKIWKE